jgi:tripartite-type tricarboxylate transporter receptor subunit TctC
VPFAAGGPTDKVARDLAEVLRKGLNNQTVVIENVGGAGGTLGAAKVAKAAPTATPAAAPHRHGHQPRRCTATCPTTRWNDFEYLGMVNDVPMTLVGRPTLPAKATTPNW